MNKKLFALFAVAALLFGMNSCTKSGKSSNEKENDSIQNDSVKQTTAFNYTPPQPNNGKKKAVVELGASGFNLFVITVDTENNWKSEKKEFGNSLIDEKATNVNEIKEKLNSYIKDIVSFGVDSKNIHFVVSSGAAKEPVITPITKALKEIGYVVNVVTPEQEAEYAFACVLPKGFENKAFVVDIGSGNTKISCMDKNNMITKETYGAKYYKKNITDAQAFDDVKAKISVIPETNCEVLFLIGGVPYDMAKSQKQGEERYTVLSTDVTSYAKLAEEEGDKFKAGLNIYKAIIDAKNPKQVVFDWDANFTIGFLLSLDF